MKKKKKISLEDIQTKHQFQHYERMYQYICEEISKGTLMPIKNSQTNGKKPALYQRYWQILEENIENEEELLEELSYKLHPSLDTSYYRRNLSQYQEEQIMVLRLSDYLMNKKEMLQKKISMNERSFDIFFREKYLDKEFGAKLLSHVKLRMEDLNFYQTSEPLAYYSNSKEAPQNILIVENKDTFYSLRKFLQNDSDKILKMKIGTLIYGGGEAIVKSFEDYINGAEKYFKCKENQLYYFGDLDYAGIQIFESLSKKYKEFVKIHVFVPAYLKMFEKAMSYGLELMPMTKDGQIERKNDDFYAYFDKEFIGKVRIFLEQRRYIPQEILNRCDY